MQALEEEEDANERKEEGEEEVEDEEEEARYYTHVTGGKLATFQKSWHSRKRGKFRDTANTRRREYRSLVGKRVPRNLRSCEPSNYVGISFDSANLAHGPAGLSLPVRDLTSEDMWRLVSSLAQKESIGGTDIAENFDVHVFNVAAPVSYERPKFLDYRDTECK
ncbi:hypothetical protein G5I_11703 [Acromyrmex echinatior]|uniref:Uncharacterized protein n=1 Tax=Acromyrmex echinatior TaxID=103372 RepID=F4X0B2_ACREC|nr:hypothetical protein G5I_11703 [Acromyrmex echinatior]